MNNWQTPLSLLVVALTVALLLRSAWKKRRKPGSGCGSDCGCPTSELKAQLKK
ncbi:FeoB-associated Cys-rich membrane protein [Rariglobus hedericola]|uniref:FeoB-associated Cys-rich membrane protein n=1 Tax=Rariglobus hedericola TaxID=2597822 RepID=A0A556QSR3_9BACT|nr:FeoB-associated Cys-rich membrane protein [Rariglobus hedericola]TSJ79671.1 FeoB-associated Cys-rich membrane protein [Rariglobus hedericola]